MTQGPASPLRPRDLAEPRAVLTRDHFDRGYDYPGVRAQLDGRRLDELNIQLRSKPGVTSTPNNRSGFATGTVKLSTGATDGVRLTAQPLIPLVLVQKRSNLRDKGIGVAVAAICIAPPGFRNR